MTNKEIAQLFALLGDLLEVAGENPFKIKSYTNAAETIGNWHTPLFEISDDALYQIPGIGQAIGEKIRQLQHTGQIKTLQKAMSATPPGILELLKISGLSAKKIGIIWRALGADTVDAFEAAATENRIAPLKGFGAKTQEGIAGSIAFYKKHLGYIMWAKAEVMMQWLMAELQQAFPGSRFEPSGDIRRQADIVNKLELVTDVPQDAIVAWVKRQDETQLLTLGEDFLTMSSVNGFPPCHIYSSPGKKFFRTLFVFTGSDEFVSEFENKYGLPENMESEEAIFTHAGIALIPPPLRNDARWIEYAAQNNLPELIQPHDIRGLIHCHSNYSDGGATLEQMATAARDKGLEYMVISDHSQAAQYAKGLYPDRIQLQHQEITGLNEKLAPFKIFKSIEADILADGSLDYSERVLSSFDLVIASVHSTLKMDEAKAMKRVLKAISNPYTAILGHMTGRLLLRRPGYPVNHKKIIEACAANSVVIEINANPRRLDMDWKWIHYALKCGVLLSINPDAHSIAGIDDLRYGVIAAQKGGLTAKHNLSSYTLAEFETFVEKSRGKRR